MKQASEDKCQRIGMSMEYYHYSIDPETLTIRNHDPDDNPFFKKITGRIRFNPVVIETKKDKEQVVKSSEDQKKLLRHLLTEGGFFGTPKKVLISSPSSDKIPMIIASCLAKYLLTHFKNPGPAFINTYNKLINEDKPTLTLRKDDKGHNHVTVYGLFGASTDYKYQEVRDVISSITWPCSVVVVAGGVANPVEFYKKKLNMEMDAVLSIADSIQI